MAKLRCLDVVSILGAMFPYWGGIGLGKRWRFCSCFFVFALGQQDISITEGVTDLGAVSTINHRYRLMEKRRHISTCRKAQPTFRHETSHCISQAQVGSIFFHDGLDRSQNIVPTHGDPQVGRQFVTRPLKVQYLISAKKRMNCSFPNLPMYILGFGHTFPSS